MVITTNQVVTQCGQVFGDETIAAAVLDRLLHDSHVLVVQGESYRLKQRKRARLVARSAGQHDVRRGRGAVLDREGRMQPPASRAPSPAERPPPPISAGPIS